LTKAKLVEVEKIAGRSSGGIFVTKAKY